MKKFFRDFVFHVFSLWLATNILPAVFVVGSWVNFAIAGFILTILVYFLEPLLKILFIPINIITFGLFSWFTHVIILFVLTVFVPEIQVRAWTTAGLSISGFVIPPIHLTYLWALVVSAVLISFIFSVLERLLD